MANERFQRTELLLGKSKMEKLYNAKVAVFGIGGVGGYAVEALARSGVGTLALFDYDKVCPSNINRQIIAAESTIGLFKVDVAKKRILDINPQAQIETHKIFYLPDTAGSIDLSQYDYIIDAIDTVTGKLELIVRSNENSIPVISSMGAGNKLDITKFEIADIYETSVCPMARVMRRELRKRGINKLKTVYSKEKPLTPVYDNSIQSNQNEKLVPGSNAYVPAAVGLIIAGEVIRDLTT